LGSPIVFSLHDRVIAVGFAPDVDTLKKESIMFRQIDLIGVPSEAGGQNGTSGGPDVIGPFLAQLLSGERDLFAQYWNIRDHAHSPYLFMQRGKKCGNVYYQKKIAKIADMTAGHVSASLAVGHLPVVLGGDHSVAIGSGRAACDPDFLHKKTVGMIWIDAHYDAPTEKTSHSHNANGMPLATLLGHGLELFRPSRIKHDGVGKYTVPCPTFLPQNVLHLGAGTVDCEPRMELLDDWGSKRFREELIQIVRRHGWRRDITPSRYRFVSRPDAVITLLPSSPFAKSVNTRTPSCSLPKK
jgi:arginase family enzyme